MIRLRKPRRLICTDAVCYYRPKPGDRPRPLPYGSVWLQIATSDRRMPMAAIRKARQSIARQIKRQGLTFARWAPRISARDRQCRGYLHHLAADVVWNEAYEAVQTGP